MYSNGPSLLVNPGPELKLLNLGGVGVGNKKPWEPLMVVGITTGVVVVVLVVVVVGLVVVVVVVVVVIVVVVAEKDF